MDDGKLIKKVLIILGVLLVMLTISIILLVDHKKLNTFEIVKKDIISSNCVSNYQYVYSDGTNKYYVDCAYTYYIKIGDTEYTLQQALLNESVTIDELIDNDITFYNIP